jgi:hypothetical protein
MRPDRRILGPSVGVLLAVALAAFGGAAALAQDKAAVAASGGGELTEGWLYLGRRSGDRWKPASSSIFSPGYPVKPGGRVVVKQDALVYGSVDCKVIDAAEFKVGETARAVLLVKADRLGLEILAKPVECPSIGQAKTVWASVRIPADRLVTVQR